MYAGEMYAENVIFQDNPTNPLIGNTQEGH